MRQLHGPGTERMLDGLEALGHAYLAGASEDIDVWEELQQFDAD